jgi:Bacterial sugar transferase
VAASHQARRALRADQPAAGRVSLIGPRHLLVDHLDHCSADQARRHAARPGGTGWTAVHGRSATSRERRLALDVRHVDHWSLGLDLEILLMAGVEVLRREGISAEGHATMRRCDGHAGVGGTGETPYARWADADGRSSRSWEQGR